MWSSQQLFFQVAGLRPRPHARACCPGPPWLPTATLAPHSPPWLPMAHHSPARPPQPPEATPAAAASLSIMHFWALLGPGGIGHWVSCRFCHKGHTRPPCGLQVSSEKHLPQEPVQPLPPRATHPCCSHRPERVLVHLAGVLGAHCWHHCSGQENLLGGRGGGSLQGRGRHPRL